MPRFTHRVKGGEFDAFPYLPFTCVSNPQGLTPDEALVIKGYQLDVDSNPDGWPITVATPDCTDLRFDNRTVIGVITRNWTTYIQVVPTENSLYRVLCNLPCLSCGVKEGFLILSLRPADPHGSISI